MTVGRRVAPRRPAPFLGALVGLALVLAACGASPDAPRVASIGPTTSSTAGNGGPGGAAGGSSNLQQIYQAQLAYSQCMRAHGEPSYPDPVLSAHAVTVNRNLDPNTPQYISATTTCKRLVPAGGSPSPAQISQIEAKTLKYSACMRSHGVPNFPDPVIRNGGIGITLKGLDPNSPQFQAAQKICQRLAPM